MWFEQPEAASTVTHLESGFFQDPLSPPSLLLKYFIESEVKGLHDKLTWSLAVCPHLMWVSRHQLEYTQFTASSLLLSSFLIPSDLSWLPCYPATWSTGVFNWRTENSRTSSWCTGAQTVSCAVQLQVKCSSFPHHSSHCWVWTCVDLKKALPQDHPNPHGVNHCYSCVSWPNLHGVPDAWKEFLYIVLFNPNSSGGPWWPLSWLKYEEIAL